MNHVEIFKRFQRLQGGEEDVPLAGRAARKVQDLSIEAMQNLPEWLKSPIRHGVGRVATNVIDPFGYDAASGVEDGSKLEQTARLFTPLELPRTLLKILQDRPAFRTGEPTGRKSDKIAGDAERARRPLFREYFDLPPQDEDNVFIKRGKNYRINPETKNEVAQQVLGEFSGPMYYPTRSFHDEYGDFSLSADVPGQPKTNMISRNYHPERPDPWDFAVSKEVLDQAKGKPLESALYGRMALEAIGKPAIFETGGYYNPPPKEDVNAAQNTGGGLARGTANVGLGIFKRAQHLAEGGSDIPAPAGAGELVRPPNLPYIQGGGLFGSNYWPAWVRYGLGAIPYVGPALNAARTGYNIYDRIHWAMTQPRLPSGQGGDTGTAPADDGTGVTAPTSNDAPTPGVGIDPTGMPADPGEWWSSDFGRWAGGDKYGTTPGDYWNQGGPGGPAGTRGIGGGGFYRTTIPGGNDQNFMPTLGGAMPAASGGGAYGGNTMAKIALHSGTFKDVATPEQWAFMQNYLSGGGGGGGSGQGVGGAGRPMTQSRQMGTSDVNPGLKLFHAKQKRKKQ